MPRKKKEDEVLNDDELQVADDQDDVQDDIQDTADITPWVEFYKAYPGITLLLINALASDTLPTLKEIKKAIEAEKTEGGEG